MTEVEPRDPDELDDDAARTTFETLARRTGLVLNLYRVLAHSPALLGPFVALEDALLAGQLDPKLREIAALRAAEINGSDYCRHYHHVAARRAGLSERQVNELEAATSSDAFDRLQRDVIRFSEQVTRQGQAEPALVERLAADLTGPGLVELTATVAFANFTNRFARTLRIGLP